MSQATEGPSSQSNADNEEPRQWSPKEGYQEALNRIRENRESGDSVLVLENLNLPEIPGEVFELGHLTGLHLQGNQIKRLQGLQELVNLQFLYISNNPIEDVRPLTQLPQLLMIDVSGVIMPKGRLGLPSISSLREVYAEGCAITTTTGLDRFVNLRILSLRNNQISNITALESLSSLEVLLLDNNELAPAAVMRLQNLSKLRQLSLSNNLGIGARIGRFGFISQLDHLEDLALNNLGFTQIPSSWLALPNLQSISLTGNPISGIDPTILNNLQALRKHYNIELSQPEPTKTGKTKGAATPDTQSVQDTITAVLTAIPSIRTAPDEALLGAPAQAEVFGEMLARAEWRSDEQFFGLFGRWGRGKSYFWQLTKQYLEKRTERLDKVRESGVPNVPFEFVEFHAWKYQDTQAVWAYLYELLVNEYNPKPQTLYNLKSIFRYWWRLTSMNYFRGNVVKPAMTFVAALFSGWFVWSTATTGMSNNETVNVAGAAGLLATAVWTWQTLNKQYGTKAQDFFKSVTQKRDFTSYLGLQHEVQKEIKNLLKAWMPIKKGGRPNKRLMLFIDDIDRCSEDKIIQIVDAVRVMLHDEDLQRQVVVVAAIDERILLRAIQNKYAMIEDYEERSKLSREYMDKLFVAGLRLGPLTANERAEIFDGYAEPITDPNRRAETSAGAQSISGTDRTAIVDEVDNLDRIVPTTQQRPAPKQSAAPVEKEEAIALEKQVEKIESSWQLEFEETEFLREVLGYFQNPTPRMIRVFTVRFLLGKKIMDIELQQHEAGWEAWNNAFDAKRWFALKLIEYSTLKQPSAMRLDMELLLKSSGQTVTEIINGRTFTLESAFVRDAYKVLAMVVAY